VSPTASALAPIDVKSSIETWWTMEYGSPSAKYVDVTHGAERHERRSTPAGSGVAEGTPSVSDECASFEGFKAREGA